MNNDMIKEILTELYELDPTLKQHEEQLIPLIKKLLENKPDTKFTKSFAQKLKNELITMSPTPSPQPWYKQISIPLSLATAAVILVLILPMALLLTYQYDGVVVRQTVSGGQRVATLGQQAFGSLAATVTTPAAESAQTQGLGNLVASQEVSRTQSGGGGGAAPLPTDAKLIAPDYYEPYRIEFNYDGTLDLQQQEGFVYKRTSSRDLGQSLIQSLHSVSPLVNIGSFSNLYLQNLAVAEDKGQGYQITFDAAGNTVQIFQNWEKWNQDYVDLPQLTQDDIPADTVLISTADAFLRAHGIDTSAYGTPIVDRTWQRYIPLAELSRFAPDVISVVYPLQIEGRATAELYGGYVGIYVSINIRDGAVTSVNNIVGQDFEKSVYPLITDTEKLLPFIKQGGVDVYTDPSAQKVYTVSLGDPEFVYARQWSWNNNRSEELFIPALSFPILEVPEGTPELYRQSVVIPLVTDFFQNGYIGIPTPIPLAEPAVEPIAMPVPGESGVADTEVK